MSFRARLARPCNYLCDQIAPVPVVHKQQLSKIIPKPIYPLALPFTPPEVIEPVCENPTVVPLQVGEYPTNRIVKPGEILVTMLEELPIGYLWCNGLEVSRTTYDLLFSIIGTYYGGGDTVSTFNLPNLTHDGIPNAKYIIKYNTHNGPCCGGGGSSGGEDLQTLFPVSPGTGEVQLLAYPIQFSPPPGTILYNTTNYLPVGYLGCDGSEISRSQYNLLFNSIGISYGNGNGVSTFNLPNLTTNAYPSYRYIIRYELPENILIQVNPNMMVTSMSLNDMAEINIA